MVCGLFDIGEDGHSVGAPRSYVVENPVEDRAGEPVDGMNEIDADIASDDSAAFAEELRLPVGGEPCRDVRVVGSFIAVVVVFVFISVLRFCFRISEVLQGEKDHSGIYKYFDHISPRLLNCTMAVNRWCGW